MWAVDSWNKDEVQVLFFMWKEAKKPSVLTIWLWIILLHSSSSFRVVHVYGTYRRCSVKRTGFLLLTMYSYQYKESHKNILNQWVLNESISDSRAFIFHLSTHISVSFPTPSNFWYLFLCIDGIILGYIRNYSSRMNLTLAQCSFLSFCPYTSSPSIKQCLWVGPW